ncbi:hypothetical protein C475_16109 [Halosimplex carlsbadense 2-9-1]|uniref:Uncharacterized protein n=1 Tax=Halosimplex carlsbadense 2-9-1 TaxID=797114 RepID=M0CMT2_9EURY|nr:hypothetical protein [Halosimplex carlsbadense]ELZ23189.1 hypothetical protein C475_16109 [Halosimplex carlsbadense 2-9-1]
MANLNAGSLNKVGIVSTLVDAALAFARGRPKSGALLVVAAALSSKVPGLGTLTSVALRIARRLQ